MILRQPGWWPMSWTLVASRSLTMLGPSGEEQPASKLLHTVHVMLYLSISLMFMNRSQFSALRSNQSSRRSEVCGKWFRKLLEMIKMKSAASTGG